MKKIITSILSLAFLFTFANFSQAQGGAFNNVLVKDLEVEYDDAKKVISGKAIIGNFSDQSFHDLNYLLQIMAYVQNEGEITSLGNAVYDKKSKKSFSIQANGEATESFIYEIPPAMPTGEYNFIFQVIDANGRSLGFDSYKFSHSNNADNLLIIDNSKSKILANNEEFSCLEGPAVEKNKKVFLEFEATNNSQAAIGGIVPNLTVYPYNTSQEIVMEKKLEVFSVAPGEKKTLNYEMPQMEKPQSYLAVIELKQNGQLISLPIRGKWVVEGPQGKIFTSGINSKNELVVETVGSPFTMGKKASLEVKILDKNRSICFSEKKEIVNFDKTPKKDSFPLIFKKKCKNPTVKIDLKMEGSLMDSYEKKLDADSVSRLNQINKEAEKAETIEKKVSSKKLIFWIVLSSILVIILILAIIFIIKKRKETFKINE